jgi:CRISPR system Cascade subunit CasA
VERAEGVLKQAFDAGPRSTMQRYKARAAALSRFHGALRGAKPVLPDLAQHYAQQRRDAAPEPQGHHHA